MGVDGDVDHPYAPRDLKLSGYVPGFLTMPTIVGVYGITSLFVVSFMWILSGETLCLMFFQLNY